MHKAHHTKTFIKQSYCDQHQGHIVDLTNSQTNDFNEVHNLKLGKRYYKMEIIVKLRR